MLNVGLSFKKNKKDKIRKDTFFFKNKDNSFKDKDNSFKDKDNSFKDKDNSFKDKDNSFKDKDKDINVRNTLIKRRIYK